MLHNDAVGLLKIGVEKFWKVAIRTTIYGRHTTKTACMVGMSDCDIIIG